MTNEEIQRIIDKIEAENWEFVDVTTETLQRMGGNDLKEKEDKET